MSFTMRSKILRDTSILFPLQIRHGSRTESRRKVSSTTLSEDVKPFESIPGLSPLPLIGGLHHFLPNGELGPQFFLNLGDLQGKYGSIVKLPGVFNQPYFVCLFQPDHLEQVFKAEEANPTRIGMETLAYYREVYRSETFQGVYGLSTAQGAQWRDFRTKVNPAMMKPKTIKLYEPGLEEIADEMVAKISKLKDQKEFLQDNFDKEVTNWALESVALVGLGARLGCLRDDLTDDHPGRKLVNCSHSFMDLVYKLEFEPSPWKFITTPSLKKLMNVLDTQWEISVDCINEAKKAIASRGHDIPEEEKSIVEKLLAIDEKVATMMGNEMLLAGIDTVTFTTLYFIYLLAVNPNVQDKLRQDIRSGSNRYLRACLKESIRIKSVAPLTLRQTTKEHIVGGYRIPKGVNILGPQEYLSNHEDHYPRPNEFLPERWLVDKNDPLYHGNAHPMVKLPFGYGIRSCIGRRIAELEMEIFVRKLIEKFKVSWDGPPVKIKCTFLNAIESPFQIKFESAV